MSDAADKALLPAGLCDVLPPQAAFEDRTTERLLAAFEAHGYERVKPPLIEFEPLLDQLQPGIGQHELRRVPGGAERHRGGLIELQVQFQSPVE